MNEIEKLLARYGGQMHYALSCRSSDAWASATAYLPDEAKREAKKLAVTVVEKGGDEGPHNEDGEQGYEGEAWTVIEVTPKGKGDTAHYMIFSTLDSYGRSSYLGFCQVEGVQETVTRFKPK